jgi:hypothetical protein
MTLRSSALSAMLSPNFVASGEDFPGARTAEFACSKPKARNSRTQRSALLWLRLRRAVSLR